MKPGIRLRSWASRWCSQRTMDRLIDPVVADLQHEYANAIHQRWVRRWILMRGYLAVWNAMTLHAPVAHTRRVLRGWVSTENWAIGRALGSAATTMVVLTVLLVAGVAQDAVRQDIRITWMLLLLLPQSFPLTLPVCLLVAVLCGLRGRTSTTAVRRSVLIVGLVGSLASFGSIEWLAPSANQAFRETIAQRHVVRGMNESPPDSIRVQALASKNAGRPDRAGVLLFAYHTRWALVGATLVFALFGLGVAALRAGRAATAGICVLASLVYISYFFELSSVSPSVFSDERVAVALAWLPNAMMILASLVFLSAGDETGLPLTAP
jgi:lipopolysaccharide export LptBFGC system permease protein LptF